MWPLAPPGPSPLGMKKKKNLKKKLKMRRKKGFKKTKDTHKKSTKPWSLRWREAVDAKECGQVGLEWPFGAPPFPCTGEPVAGSGELALGSKQAGPQRLRARVFRVNLNLDRTPAREGR
jgi:hypothetical protein